MKLDAWRTAPPGFSELKGSYLFLSTDEMKILTIFTVKITAQDDRRLQYLMSRRMMEILQLTLKGLYCKNVYMLQVYN